VKLRLLPAPAGTGIIFRRVDLDNFEVEATGRNVARVSYATSLMKQGVLISTTEHLLSAFIGTGVDNAFVELDNLELPILDGSAKPFVDMVQSVGLRLQRRKRSYLRIRKELEVREGGKFIGVYPVDDDSYSVSYSIDFPHPLIGKTAFELFSSKDAETITRFDREALQVESRVVDETFGRYRLLGRLQCLLTASKIPQRYAQAVEAHRKIREEGVGPPAGEIAKDGHRLVGGLQCLLTAP